jgi:hypothetical protein
LYNWLSTAVESGSAKNLIKNNSVGRAFLPVEREATGKSARPTKSRNSSTKFRFVLPADDSPTIEVIFWRRAMMFRVLDSLLCVSLCVLVGCADSAGPVAQPTATPTSGAVASASGGEEAKIEAAINELSEEDRELAKAQKFCAVAATGRLGSMGKPVKVMVDGKPVFLCCEGCESEALKNPEETLAKVEKLKEASAK